MAKSVATKDVLQEVYGGISKFQERLSQRSHQWAQNLQRYHGAYDIAPGGQRRVVSNLIFGLVQRIIPSIYYKNPYVLVSPRGGTPQQYSQLLETLLNYLIGVIGVEQEMRKVVFDTLFKGIGFVKVGMLPLETSSKTATRSGGISQDKLLQALYLTQQQTPEREMPPERGSKEDLSQLIQSGFDESVIHNRPYLVRIPPNFMAADPHATSISNARWVGQKILRPLDEVRKDEQLSKAKVKGVEATYSEDAFEDLYSAWNVDQNLYGLPEEDAKKRGDLVELWEIWYKPTRKVYTFSAFLAANGDYETLAEKEWPYEFDEFPYEDLRFNADPDTWFGVPDVSTWDSLVTAYNAVQSMQARHISRFNRKYVLSEQTAAKAGVLDQLQSGEDGTAIVVPDEVAAGAIVPLVDATLSPDVYALKQQLKDDLTFVSGVTYQRQGTRGKSGTTATEASLLEAQAQLRDNDRMFLVSKFTESACKKILQLARQSLSMGDVAFAIGDPRVAQYWHKVAPELNRAEVDVHVRIGSTAFQTKELRLKQLLDFMNVASRLVDQTTQMPLLNNRVLAMRIAEGMDLENPEELLMPDMNPMAGYTPQQGGQGQGAVPRGIANPGADLSAVQNVSGRPLPSGAPGNE